jgi:hypothetical protein
VHEVDSCMEVGREFVKSSFESWMLDFSSTCSHSEIKD